MEKDYDIEVVNDVGKTYAIAVPKDANVKSAVINQYRDDNNALAIHLEKINERSNTSKKDERFKAIICHFSEPSLPYNDVTYDNVINQWKPYAGESRICDICLQPHSQDLCFIINTENKNILLVGSCCINKFGGSILSDQNKQLSIELAKVFTCSICKLITKLDGSQYKDLCNTCSITLPPLYLQTLKQRCKGCEEFRKITKDLCSKCKKENRALCASCNAPFTKKESYYKSCDQCFNDTRHTIGDPTYKTCITCKRPFKLNIQYPNNKECYPCFKKGH